VADKEGIRDGIPPGEDTLRRDEFGMIPFYWHREFKLLLNLMTRILNSLMTPCPQYFPRRKSTESVSLPYTVATASSSTRLCSDSVLKSAQYTDTVP